MRIVIALLILSLVILAGCAKQADEQANVVGSQSQSTEATPTATLNEANQLLMNENDQVEIGEML